MRVYYRDDRVQVTSDALYVDNACYPYDRLGDMWVSRRSLAARRILIGLGILAAAVLIRIVASFVWFLSGVDHTVERWMSGGPTTVAAVAVVALGVAVVGVLIVEAALSAIEDIRGYGRNLELWATMDGQPVRLYHTNNAQRFGQIRRALVRALG